VHALEIHDRVVRFRLDGPIDPIIKTVARHSVVDFDSRAADLDEIFLAYYRDADHPEARPTPPPPPPSPPAPPTAVPVAGEGP
jgi:hypothetical protein